MAETISIRPQPRQEQFLANSADIVVFGGAAGGGKTWGLLMEPLRHVATPGFGCVVFRRIYPQISAEGGMWDESHKIYPYRPLSGRPIRGRLEWIFPAGSRISFRHMQHEKDREQYKGAQICLLEFDQAEEFSESQFFYMLSRNRSTCGVKPYVRMSVNPDPDSWLAKFLAWWIAEDGYADLDRAGKTRWFVRERRDLEWADTAEELEAKFPALQPKSVSFIPSTIYDNPILIETDPGYLANLMSMLPVDKARLLGDPKRGGNWKVRPEAGKVFNRDWFEVVGDVPKGGTACRFWDFAATAKKAKGDDPSFTAGVKMLRHKSGYFVLHMLAFRKDPDGVRRVFIDMCRADAEAAREDGRAYKVRWEQEPGSAGKRESVELTKLLAGLDAKGVPSRGDKLTRAQPLARQSGIGNVKLLKAKWNERWLTHMHHQPDIKHTDIMDASSGAFNALTAGTWVRGARR